MKIVSQPFFIFEMANNHQGRVDHGLKIIEEMARLARHYGLAAAVKLQYRDLDTFIHPDFVGRKDVKHIPRFMETRLNGEQFQTLAAAIKAAGLKLVITPFDESSVQRCLDHGVDILKIASCSCRDWPLLEAIAAAGPPIICSTGGCQIADIDKVVTFLEHKNVTDLSLLHCVGIYPTEDKDQNLNFMYRMMRRYPQYPIGFSGHEKPDNLRPGAAAAAMGAAIFERHVGVPTESIKLNNYSMSPEETARWVEEILTVGSLVGSEEDKKVNPAESESLLSLQRGVYAAAPLAAGIPLERKQVFFAMPCAPGQMSASEWREGVITQNSYSAGEKLLERRTVDSVQLMRSVVHEAKGLLREAGIAIGRDYEIELSHHYGMEKFRQVGAVIVNYFNREYCKKLIILLPGQEHPLHAHTRKEETFQILYGGMKLTLDGEKKTMIPGDIELVRRGQIHGFVSPGGVIFEEISTTHFKGDSKYEDPKIAQLDPSQRKTVLEMW